MSLQTAVIALGANLGDREETIHRACRLLAKTVGPLRACSPLVETQPVGFTSAHTFLNGVALFDTTLDAHALLDATEAVERRLGRTCKSHDGAYADRTIDLDIIMLGRTVCADERLTLPHPRYHNRRFVLEPLMAVAPEMADPVSRLTVAQMMERLNRPRIDALPRRTADDAEALAAACADINALLPALTAHAAPLTPATLAALLRNAMTTIYLCRDEEERVAGMATLCLCASPTGTKAWVEDVVVRPDCRGRGYGAALIAHLTAESRRMEAKSINLTSKPQREAANRLYQRMGFCLRETNVYRKESQ